MAVDVRDVVEKIGGIDCRDVAERLIGQPYRAGTKRHTYFSPLRDDGRNPSFMVTATGWKDFGGSHEGGNGITLVKRILGEDWAGAWAWFAREFPEVPSPPGPLSHKGRGGETRFDTSSPGGRTHGSAPTRPKVQHRRERVCEAPPVEWQARAMDLIVSAERTLWSDRGGRALAYLRDQRGLTDETIKAARLGYVPGGHTEWKKMYGFNVPCGIVIPWIIEGDVWMVKVRRAAGKPKYMQVKGGVSDGLYMVDRIQPVQDVMVVEGEFDALVVSQATQLIAGVALGSSSNTVQARWMSYLVRAARIYARMDDDEAGHHAEARLRMLSGRVVPVQVEEGYKDINEWWLADCDGLRGWLRELGMGKGQGQQF